MRTDVVVRASTLSFSRALLLALVVATMALAGCSAKKDRADEATDPDPVGPTPGDVVWSAGFEPTFITTPPPDCDGCIPLGTGGAGDATGAGARTFTVPFPAFGDVIEAWAERGPDQDVGTGIPFPVESFRFGLKVVKYTTDDSSSRPHDPLVQLVLQYGEGDTWLQDPHETFPRVGTPFTLEEQDVYVDPATRLVTLVESTGWATPHVDAFVGSSDSPPVSTHQWLRPPADSLFWLGAHAWGRTWTEGGSATFRWQAAPDETIEFRYHAAYVAPPTQGDADEVALRLELTASENDGFAWRSWTMEFVRDSPYPTYVTESAENFPAYQPLLPGPLAWQSIELVARGTGSIEWPPLQATITPAEETRQGPMYRVDERIGSPALVRFPVYPLAAAIADLRLLDDGFQEWLADHPDNVLIVARLAPKYVAADAGDMVEYTWTLTFTDGHGSRKGWEAARMATAEGTLAPVAHRAVTTDAEFVVHADVRASEHAARPLSATEHLGADLQRFDIGGPIDDVVYRLFLDDDGALQGTLHMGHAAGVGETGLGPGWAEARGGYVIADLVTGVTYEAVRFDV